MAKAEIDWGALANSLAPKAAKETYEVTSGQFSKIAFDVYRKNNDNSLWELREVDGKKLLFALYDDESDEQVKTASSRWSAFQDSAEQNVTLVCDNVPIFRFAAQDYNFHGEAARFASYIANKASTDKEFVDSLLEQMTPARRASAIEVIRGDKK